MDSIYYFPPEDKNGGYKNPYSQNVIESLSPYFKFINKQSSFFRKLPKGLNFLMAAFSADIYIVSWLESICFGKFAFLQYIFAKLALNILKIRNVKILWIFHNIHPHQGSNFMSKSIQTFLFQKSDLIITHSNEAVNFAKSYAKCPVIYKCHPFNQIIINRFNKRIEKHDVFIWGAILPYKGVLEFLLEHKTRQSKLSVYILGKCNDPVLSKAIRNMCNTYISYDNRVAGFDEIAANIKKSRFVLFPYIGSCVSSSGALIDTIVMHGVPIGPNKGAFIDLAYENLCITYNNYDELFNLLSSHDIILDNNAFIKNNSWTHFGCFLKDIINKIQQ